jgi:hypothetical protein
VRAQAGNSPAHIAVRIAPSKVVCVGETATIANFNYWETTGSELAPLASGTLVTTATKGSLDQPSLSVGNLPGLARLTYTAATAGKETVVSTLSYGTSGSASVTIPFQVKKCNYRLSIRATDSKAVENVRIVSWFESVGNISISGKVNGELPASIGFNLNNINQVISCDMEPAPQATSKVTVSGNTSTDIEGNVSVHLIISYKTFPSTPASQEVCKDNTGQHQIQNVAFPPVPAYDPSTDLLTTLDFAAGKTFIKGTFGPGGTAYYYLTPVNDNNGQ